MGRTAGWTGHPLAAVLACLLVGCGPRPSATRPSFDVDLVWRDEQLQVLQVARAGGFPSQFLGTSQVGYGLIDAVGATVARGLVGDPRPMADGMTAPVRVRLPAVPGSLQLFETPAAGGGFIGEVDFVPVPTGPPAAGSHGDGVAQIAVDPVIVVDNGDGPTVAKLLFISEGYTEDMLDAFASAVSTIAGRLARRPDYGAFWDHFTIYRWDVASVEFGVSDPTTGTSINSAFGVAFEADDTGGDGEGSIGDGTDDGQNPDGSQGPDGESMPSNPRRCPWFTSDEGMQRAWDLGNRVGANAVILLIPSADDAGCGKQGFIVATAHGGYIVPHELGHGVFGLADEYEEASGALRNCSTEVTAPNIAYDLDNLPWQDLLDRNVPLPTDDTPDFSTAVGAFEGALYCHTGRYRAQESCLMRLDNRAAIMCAACQARMRQMFYGDDPPFAP
jgi:hypothetical protein